jgi:hypothetical protein
VKVRISLTGTTPMLMHSARTVDPLDPLTQQIKAYTSKRKKTDDDHAAIARLEFMAGLYYDRDAGPYVPGENIFRALVEGGKLTKSGVKVTRGMLITTEVNPLVYKGPRTQEELWEQGYKRVAPVRVGMARTVRCRPQFQAPWSVDCEALLDTSVLSLPDLRKIAETSGQMIGLGDWRPRFGRYQAVVEEV